MKNERKSSAQQHKVINRRAFLKTSLKTGALAGALIGSGTIASKNLFTTRLLEINTLEFSIPKLNKRLDGFTLAFLTDPHYSPAMKREWITTAINQVKKSDAELLLLGGDYIWIPHSTLSKQLLISRDSELNNLPDEKLAELEYHYLFEEIKKITSDVKTVGVLGNHDRWTDVTLCKDAFKNSNATLLINQREDFTTQNGGAVEVYGTDDYWTGIPKKPTYSSSTETLKILLSHNPDFIAERCKSSLPDHTVTLSGHTHGGQICLPIYGPLLYNIQSRSYGYGPVQERNFLHFTSRGMGVVEIPYRVLCPQELVFIRFVRSQSTFSATYVDQTVITL